MFRGTTPISVQQQIEKVFTAKLNKEIGAAKRKETVAANKQTKIEEQKMNYARMMEAAEMKFHAERNKRLRELSGEAKVPKTPQRPQVNVSPLTRELIGTGQATNQGIGRLTGQGTNQGIVFGTGQATNQGIGRLTGQGTNQGIVLGTGQASSQGMGRLTGQGTNQGIVLGTGQASSQGIGQATSHGIGQATGSGINQGIGRGTCQGISSETGQVNSFGHGSQGITGGYVPLQDLPPLPDYDDDDYEMNE